MKTLTIDLENCYGIRKLEKKLDFSLAQAIAIYAPNGSMKTSLTQAFDNIASKRRVRPRTNP